MMRHRDLLKRIATVERAILAVPGGPTSAELIVLPVLAMRRGETVEQAMVRQPASLPDDEHPNILRIYVRPIQTPQFLERMP